MSIPKMTVFFPWDIAALHQTYVIGRLTSKLFLSVKMSLNEKGRLQDWTVEELHW